MAFQTTSKLLHSYPSLPINPTQLRPLSLPRGPKRIPMSDSSFTCDLPSARLLRPCKSSGRKSESIADSAPDDEENALIRRILQSALWTAEGVYVLWLFLLPYAPMAEGLFNLVIGWTLLFAPLLFTDTKGGRYNGSLDVLWSMQMFLTNTFLIPYMAFRLNNADGDAGSSKKESWLGGVMRERAAVVGIAGGAVCLASVVWGLQGRPIGGFGDVSQRVEFLASYLGSERLAYAFVWDICLYTIFQPWLIGENLQNVEQSRRRVVDSLRAVPVVGLVAYSLFLNRHKLE